MWKNAVVAMGTALLVVPTALAQSTGEGQVDANQAGLGAELYGMLCAACHMQSGRGTFDFPRLNRNPNVAQAEAVVSQIHLGSGAMPAFPDLDADEIAAIATHLRTAWNNRYGPVTVDEVVAILEGFADLPERTSIWAGVYTTEQAERGQRVFVGRCADCHGPRGDGVDTDPDQPAGPPVAGGSFLAEWQGQTVYTLFAYTRLRMPTINPGSLSDEDYIDAIAFMLGNSGVPPGETELPVEQPVLRSVQIDTEPP